MLMHKILWRKEKFLMGEKAELAKTAADRADISGTIIGAPIIGQ